MKNRLSLPTTIIVYLDTIFIGIGTMWLLEYELGLPEWITLIIAAVIILVSYEFVGRLGPEKFDAPISHFLKLSQRDKVVFLVGPLALFVIVLIGKSLHSGSGWINLLILVLGFSVWRLIDYFFGSHEFMGKPSKDHDKA